MEALAAELQGNAPQVLSAKCRRYTDPPRCTTLLKLWEAWPLREQVCNELAFGGLFILEPLKAQALDKLIPESLLQIVVGRLELSAYSPKLQCFKAQMEHAKGAAQASYVSAALRDLYEAFPDPSQNPQLFWDLQEVTQRCAQTADWAGFSAATAALQQLYAVAKGKRSKGKRKWGKG